MTEQFANFAQSSLGSAITASQTVISVADASLFPLIGNFRIVVQSFDATTQIPTSAPEIMLVTAVAGKNFTVTRAAESSTNFPARAFASGAQVTQIITKAVMDALEAGGGGGSGTVTSVSVTSANGLAGTVANATTTPAITLSTTVTGILKGDGTVISAASPSDFPILNQNTTGSAGTVSTINGLVAQGTNITLTGAGTSASPYTINASGGGTGTVTTTGTPLIGQLAIFSGSTSITNGDLSGDVTTTGGPGTTVAKIQGTTVSGTTGTGNVMFSASPTTTGTLTTGIISASGNIGTTGSITSGAFVQAAASSGVLWNGRSRMQSDSDGSIRLSNSTQTGFTSLLLGGTTSSFPALFVSGASLKVRLADNSGDAALTTGALTTSGTNIFSALTTNGLLKTSGGTGTISVATAGTDYQAPITAGTGLTLTGATLSVNTSQNIATLSNLTTNGFVKTSGATGTLSIDTTSYFPTPGSQTAKFFYAAPNGTAGTPSFRAIVASDIPTLNQSTTGNAATVTTNANLTGVITSVGNATSIASQTGTGTKFVVDTSPTISGATLSGTTTLPNGGLIEAGFSGNGTWFDLPTTGASGIGTGGPGVNPFVAYVPGANFFFNGSAIGDVAYRNASGTNILMGIDNGAGTAVPSLRMAGNLLTLGAAQTFTLDSSGGVNTGQIKSGSASVANSITLANVSGMSWNLVAGQAYAFNGWAYATGTGSGGSRIGLGGTATVTGIRATSFHDNSSVYVGGANTGATGPLDSSANSSVVYYFNGIVIINAAGTFTFQFAQSSSNATASNLVNAWMEVWKLS